MKRVIIVAVTETGRFPGKEILAPGGGGIAALVHPREGFVLDCHTLIQEFSFKASKS
jgi:hypothetical protein